MQSEIEILITRFKELKIKKSVEKMAEMADLRAMVIALEEKLNANTFEMKTLSDSLNEVKNVPTITEHADIMTVYLSGDTIQLDAFKVIPEFNGDKFQYRSWRSQVTKLMTAIGDFKTHPRYATALAIVRAKITKAASDILINNNTVNNFDAIIDRLDFSFADQRPLYLIEAEMTSIKQGNKSLQEFFDAINQALNLVMTKITMTYKEKAAQQSLITEAKQKSVRTFTMGLNSSFMRTTLYGNTPKSLAEAFAIAQTIFYDNQHMMFEKQNSEKIRPRQYERNNMREQPTFNPNFRYENVQRQNLDSNQIRKPFQKSTEEKLEPMDVDPSRQFVKTTQQQSRQFSKPNLAVKRDFNSSRNYSQPLKLQRVNNIDEKTAAEYREYDSLTPEFGEEVDNLSECSAVSKTSSAFLEE